MGPWKSVSMCLERSLKGKIIQLPYLVTLFNLLVVCMTCNTLLRVEY